MSELSRRWCYTLNNYTPEEGLNMMDIPCVYSIVGKETSSIGTPHLQGYVIFQNGKRLGGVKKINARAHWEVARGTTDENIKYCSKEGDFYEKGQRPKNALEQAYSQRQHWQQVIASARAGTAEQDFPREFIQYNSTINRLYSPKVETIPEYTGLWWTGPPGTGKSRKAREDYPGLYDKLLNKWWDGYVDEEVVLIDDIDPTHINMGLFLKRYADHYPFRAEYKGGSKVIRPKVIIVTSNYSIEEIFGLETEMTKAIKRRYKVTHFRQFF